MSIESNLAKLGIAGNLFKVYRAAIELGETPVSALVEQSGLPKATVYDAIARLEQEGLMVSTGEPRRRRVTAYDPAVLQEQLEAKRQMLDDMLPQLRSFYNHLRGKPQIRFYDSADGVQKALLDALSCTSGLMHCTFAMPEILEIPGLAFMDEFTAQRVERRIFMKVIRSPQRDTASIWPASHKDMRELRFAPDALALSMTALIYDNRVALASSKRESYGLIIESEEFASLMRTMFEAVWNQSTPAPWQD
jgi:sugar-specific transcriptional regulator TrmB